MGPARLTAAPQLQFPSSVTGPYAILQGHDPSRARPALLPGTHPGSFFVIHSPLIDTDSDIDYCYSI